MLRRQGLGAAGLALAAALLPALAGALSPCAEPTPAEVAGWQDFIDHTSYDVGIKTLLRHMAANSYAGDLRAAMSIVAAERPEMALGDTPNFGAAGKSQRFAGGRAARITVTDRALYLTIPGSPTATLQWSDPRSYRRALGFAPPLLALDPKARPVEVYSAKSGVVARFRDGSSLGDWSLDQMAVVLLHELIHLNSSLAGGQAADADELRATLASDRMKQLIEERGRGQWQLHDDYQAWRREPAAAVPPGIPERIARRRAQLAAQLALGDRELEALAEDETLEGFRHAVREYRALADRLRELKVIGLQEWQEAMAHIQDLHQKALLEQFLWPQDRGDLRETLRQRLSELAADERLYGETVRVNEAWARECRGPAGSAAAMPGAGAGPTGRGR